jgi:GH43 family beta-xylosidase
MNWLLILALLFAAPFTTKSAQSPESSVASAQAGAIASNKAAVASNPIFAGADPHAIVVGNTFWVYPTRSERGRQQFFAFSSTNLMDWEKHGPVLDFRDITWIDDDGAKVHYAWAPSVFESGGKFYFYFAVGPQHPTPSRIGVAVGDSPDGPFKDSGKPLLTGREGFEAIDPMVFRDPKSGVVYLYAGGSAGAKLRVFELSTNLVEIAREIRVETPKNFTEGAFMHFYKGHYYLSYSHGGYRDASYSVHYASSESPTGPWVYHGKILGSDETRKGPGHHSFLQDPRTGEWLIFYHRWENQSGNGPYRGSRQVCIDRVEYDAEGLIRPVVMTTGSAAQQATFTNPLNPGPDPFIVVHEGNYYLTTTQGDCIRIWKAPTLAKLKTAPGILVWRDDNPSRSDGIWAPELHYISNRWYLYYTAMAATRVDTTHRMHVLESEGQDPLGPYHYKGRLFDPANDFYAIDGSVFKHPGDQRWCFLWAAHPGHRIRISRMANPWTLEGKSVVIPASGFGCEEVREGPVVLQRNGKLFLTYSACDTGKPDYKIGMLIADDDSDVMDPKSWVQYPTPIFERNDGAGVYGPGHHGFFQSPDGTEDWIIYHGKTSSAYTYAGRTTRAQKFTWDTNGIPQFGKPLPLSAILPEPSNRKAVARD